jgi:hypothetical protein
VNIKKGRPAPEFTYRQKEAQIRSSLGLTEKLISPACDGELELFWLF